MVEQPIKKVQVRCQICNVYINDNFIIETKTTAKTLSHKTLCLSFLFLFCVNGTPSFLAIIARYFMSADFTSLCFCLTSVTIPLCGPVHRVKSNHIKQVRGSLLSGLGNRFQNLNLLHFDKKNWLEVFIDLSLLTGSIKFRWIGSQFKPHRRHCFWRKRER